MGLFGAFWGIAGVLLLIGYAVFRLTFPTIEAFSHHFMGYHWAVLVLNITLAAYLKGYRGFQKGLSPRVAARAKYLHNHPHVLRALLGPLYCMGYFHIVKKKQIVTILMTAGMVILILLVRLLNQPWRGIIDAGIVIALSWGFITLLIFTGQAFVAKKFKHSPQIPEEHPQ
jgi:hypothetical protein